MATDISALYADSIDTAQTYAQSDNLRCGKNDLMITRIRMERFVDKSGGEVDYGFVEMIPTTSEPNPQNEGDREGFTWSQQGGYVAGAGKLLDDGSNPNPVGSPCALKANFTGNRKVAESKMKNVVLAIFGKGGTEVPKGMVGSTLKDLCRAKDVWLVPGWRLNTAVVPAGTPGAVEDLVDFVYTAAGPVPVTKDTPGAIFKRANPAAGYLIRCVSTNRKKKTPNQQGAYVCTQNWITIAPIGHGENTEEAMRARLEKFGTASNVDDVVEDDDAPPPAPGAPAAAVTPAVVVQAAANAAPPPPVEAPPPPPVVIAWEPKAPWVRHPDAAQAAKGWCWSSTKLGGDNSVKKADVVRALPGQQ